MVTVVVQTQLIAARQHHVHVALGGAAMLFAFSLIPIMYLTAAWSVARASVPPHDALASTIGPFSTMAAFAILVWQGWKHRKQAQWHKRLMLSATIVIVMGPAFVRVLGRDVLRFVSVSPPVRLVEGGVAHILGLALFLPLFVWDRHSERRVHPATWLGFGIAVAVVTSELAVHWGGLDWASVAAKLPGVGS